MPKMKHTAHGARRANIRLHALQIDEQLRVNQMDDRLSRYKGHDEILRAHADDRKR